MYIIGDENCYFLLYLSKRCLFDPLYSENVAKYVVFVRKIFICWGKGLMEGGLPWEGQGSEGGQPPYSG